MQSALKKHEQKRVFGLPPADYDNDVELEFREWFALEKEGYFYQGDTKDGVPEGRGIRITPHGNVRLTYKKDGLEHGPYTTFKHEGTIIKGNYK